MIEFNQRIEEQIAEILRRDGRVSPDGLPGLPPEDGERLLRRYAEVHSDNRSVDFDGRVLARTVGDSTPPVAVAGPRSPSGQSPVEQILAAPVGKALLDSAPLGPPVNRALWLLPLSLGLPGGLIAWFVVRDSNARVARSLLILGVVVQLFTVVISAALGPSIRPMLDSLVPGFSTSGAADAQVAFSPADRTGCQTSVARCVRGGARRGIRCGSIDACVVRGSAVIGACSHSMARRRASA